MSGSDDRTFVLRRMNGNDLEYLFNFSTARGTYRAVATTLYATRFTWIQSWDHFVKNPLKFKDWHIVELNQACKDEDIYYHHKDKLIHSGNTVIHVCDKT